MKKSCPRIISEVQTTLTPIKDSETITLVHKALQAKNLLSGDHLVDTTYHDAELLMTSQKIYGVSLVGPTRFDTGWQVRPAGSSITE